MCDRAHLRPEHEHPTDVVPLPPAMADKLTNALAQAGFQLNDPSVGYAVMRLMVAMGKPTFRLIASLERMGHRPDVKDRSVVQYGTNAAIAFGWHHIIARLGSPHRRWVWLEPDGVLEGGDLYRDEPRKAALHDWMRMRRTGSITRLVRH